MKHTITFGLLALGMAFIPVSDAQTVTPLSRSGLDSLIHQRSGRPLVLNLWATWCAPCKEEFPDLMQASKEYPDVEAVALSVDFPDEIESKILPFLKDMKITLPVFVSAIKKQEDVINALHERWNGALPATFVFTSEGVRDTFFVGKQSLGQFRSAFKNAHAQR